MYGFAFLFNVGSTHQQRSIFKEGIGGRTRGFFHLRCTSVACIKQFRPDMVLSDIYPQTGMGLSFCEIFVNSAQ
jgi:hypothetical protein